MAQSEIFTHFLDSARYGNKDNSKKKGGRTRMEESEEDSILMQQAQSKVGIIFTWQILYIIAFYTVCNSAVMNEVFSVMNQNRHM